MIYAKIHNVNARKRSDLIQPDKILKDMFGDNLRPGKKQEANLLDKFRIMALETGGRDHRSKKR
jgi:chromatin remodeling complex protein RSC6